MSEDRVMLITGASSGIGSATARAAAAAGYRVPGTGYRMVLAARSVDALDALAAELGEPDRSIAVRCDGPRDPA